MRARKRRFLTPLAAFVVAVVFLLGVYFPQSRQLSRIRQETASVREQQLDRAARLRSTMATLDKAGSEGDIPFEEAVPSSPRIGELLESLDRLAREAGLADHSVVPAKVVDGEQVSWLPIDMEFRGTFAAVYGFLERVETLPRVARVQRLELDSTAFTADELSSSLTMHVYFKRS